jgi:hypothetical protein
MTTLTVLRGVCRDLAEALAVAVVDWWDVYGVVP